MLILNTSNSQNKKNAQKLRVMRIRKNRLFQPRWSMTIKNGPLIVRILVREGHGSGKHVERITGSSVVHIITVLMVLMMVINELELPQF